MGTSLAMIDRHYGHLARDGREHAIRLLDTYTAAEPFDVHAVDAGWTPLAVEGVNGDNGKWPLSRTGLFLTNCSTPPGEPVS
jgi:hypothetical protein